MDESELISRIRHVLDTEAAALGRVAQSISMQDASAICRLIHRQCDGRPGRLAVTGVGKAGLIGHKIAASAASTGTPAFTLHPTEARHGDLGMLTEHDVVLALSNSGSSEELVDLLPAIRRIGPPVVALVGRADSPLARFADHVLAYGNVTEVCPHGLAPSTSTTIMLALGDALVLAVQQLRAFAPEDYARFHPGGALGRRLMTCREAMRQQERLPVIAGECSVLDALQCISRARAGAAVLIDDQAQLLGIFTDGDLRRALAGDISADTVLQQPVHRHATVPCSAIGADELLEKALHLFASRHFNELPVIDDQRHVLGLIDIQDLAHRGFDVPLSQGPT